MLLVKGAISTVPFFFLSLFLSFFQTRDSSRADTDLLSETHKIILRWLQKSDPEERRNQQCEKQLSTLSPFHPSSPLSFCQEWHRSWRTKFMM